VSGHEHFLLRWSRRKRQAENAETERRAQAASSEDVSVAPVPPEIATFKDVNDEPVPELSVDELALLPRIEDLTVETDLSQFLRKGVPTALRNAALRRMWVLDPSIRDYVSEAREYAYDWNAPGGVPGSGALLAQDVSSIAPRITRDSEQPTRSQTGAAGAAMPDGEAPPPLPEALSRAEAEPSHIPQRTSEPAIAPTAALDGSTESAPHGQASAGDDTNVHNERFQRRQGSAIPT
jgi:Protein of unknown function (DUF3306)